MQTSLSFGFRLGRTTVSNIIKETCNALWDILSPLYVNFPKTQAEWIEVSNSFEAMWNLPHCIGSIDGKHVTIDCPSSTGSKFYNYKGHFSVVILGLCDAHYRYMMVDIGSYGSQSDGGVFAASSFGAKMISNRIPFPNETNLPGSTIPCPYFYVGDEAFPLSTNMMRPYPGRNLTFSKKVFNYRLSRARRVIENTFGVMAARWRIFRRPIKAIPENVDAIVKAAVCLHNYMMTTEEGLPVHRRRYNSPGFFDTEDAAGNTIPGQWRQQDDGDNALRDSQRDRGVNRHTIQAGDVRNKIATYLCKEGAVPWQEAYVNRS